MKHIVTFPNEDAESRHLPFREPDFAGGKKGLRLGVVVLVIGLLRVQGNVEVVVEIVAERRQPRKGPSHSLLKRFDLLERRTRDNREGGVSRGQMDNTPGDIVHEVRTAFAAFLPLGVEHEVVDDELSVPPKEVAQSRWSARTLEDVIFCNLDDRELVTLSG